MQLEQSREVLIEWRPMGEGMASMPPSAAPGKDIKTSSERMPALRMRMLPFPRKDVFSYKVYATARPASRKNSGVLSATAASFPAAP